MKEHKSQTIKRAARDARTLGKRELAMMLEAVAAGVEQTEHHPISTGEQYRWSLAVARSLKLAESLAAEVAAEREKTPA